MDEVIQVAVANWSTALRDREVDEGIEALQSQLDRDFSPEWGVRARLFALRPVEPRAGVFGLVLRPDPSAGAVRLEATTYGLPLADVFLGDLEAGQQWTQPASRELLRLLVDPVTGGAVLGPAGPRWEYRSRVYPHDITAPCAAYEHGYEIGGWQVSDFVRRAWFGDVPAVHGYDHCGRIHHPFGVLEGDHVFAYDLASDTWLEIGARRIRIVEAPPGLRLARFACGFSRPRRRPPERIVEPQDPTDPIWGGP
jgi:hypothetical protein